MRPQSQCHPERLHVAHGLCRQCYNKGWHRDTYVNSLNPEPWKESLKKALQVRWANHVKDTKEQTLAKHAHYVLTRWLPENRERLNASRRERWKNDLIYRHTKARQTRNTYIKHKYGLTRQQLEELEKAHDGKCAVCDDRPRLLVIDHDHQDNLVRGLLCDRCNRLLGVAQDNPIRLEQAAQYLRRKPWLHKNS